MTGKEFWQLVYAAAINNNHSNKVALGIANDALDHWNERWHKKS